MTSATKPARRMSALKSSDKDTEREESERSERALGRAAAIGVPVVTVIGCIVTGLVSSAGPAILVLAGGVLFGTICLLWASLRTLGGDAPLPEDLEAIAARMHSVNDVESRKKAILMSLKDLENERAIGKVDESDYGELAARYRDQAKRILRELDEQVEPMRERAEQLAQAHLKKKGLAKRVGAKVDAPEETPEETDAATENDTASATADEAEDTRLDCPSCAVSNERDAAFCKKCGAAMRPSTTTKGEHDASE